MARILVLSEATLPYFMGGGEVFLDNFVNFLRSRGHRVVVLSNKIHVEERFCTTRYGAKYYRVPPTVPPPSFYGWPKTLASKIFFVLKKIFREILKVAVITYIYLRYRPEVLVLNGVSVTAIPSFLPGATILKAWRILKLTRAKILLIVHAINPPSGRTLRNTISDMSVSHRVVCVEEWMVKKLCREKPSECSKITWIPNGVDPDRFPYQPLISQPNILFIGRLSPDHGLDILLHAMEKVREKHPGLRVRIIGTGPCEDKYKALAGELGLEDIIEFKGSVPNEELPREYHWASIVINPIRVDAIGITTLEAMSCGRIVIKSSSRNYSDPAIEDGVNGFLFKLADTQDLVLKLEEIFSMPSEELELVSLSARKTVEEKFSLSGTFEKYEKVILSLLT